MLHPSTSYTAVWIFIHLRHQAALTKPHFAYNQKLGAPVHSTLLDDFGPRLLSSLWIKHEMERKKLGVRGLFNLGLALPSSWWVCTTQIGLYKCWFSPDVAVCVFCSGLHQCKDRKFSISLQKHNHHAENAVMWMSLKYSQCTNDVPMILH